MANEVLEVGAMANGITVARDVPCSHSDSSDVGSDNEVIRPCSKATQACSASRKAVGFRAIARVSEMNVRALTRGLGDAVDGGWSAAISSEG